MGKLVEFVQSLGINYNRYKAQNLIRSPLRLDECTKIARALDVPLEYLATGEAGEELTADEKELLSSYRDASEESRANAQDLLRASAERNRRVKWEKNA